MYTLGTAALATGLSKSTIHRAIRKGRISATRHDDGSYSIDPAELHRVFPPAAIGPEGSGNGSAESSVGRSATPADTPETLAKLAALEAEIAGLKSMVQVFRETLDATRADRDAWQRQAEATQRLLTDQRQRPGLLARLLRRA